MNTLTESRPVSRLVNVAETAGRMGIKPSTLRTWMCRGTCPLPVVRVGAAVRFRLSDIEALIMGDGKAGAQ
jgi:predicted DNA-binding transcriptional regulator AlpA